MNYAQKILKMVTLGHKYLSRDFKGGLLLDAIYYHTGRSLKSRYISA